MTASIDQSATETDSEYQPQLTVIIPIYDYRFQPRFLNSWTRKQRLDQSSFELIVVAPPSYRNLEAEIYTFLRTQDRLVFVEGNRSTHYAIGCQLARSKNLLLTEDHCVAHPDCLIDVFEYLSSPNVTAICLASGFINNNSLAEMEGELLDGFYDEWSEPDHWNKVHVRGFAIRKKVLEQVGGIVDRYGLFAETALSIELHRRGIKVHYLADKRVVHVNGYRWRDYIGDVYGLAYGECQFRAESPDLAVEDMLGEIPGWLDRLNCIKRANGVLISASRDAAFASMRSGDYSEAVGFLMHCCKLGARGFSGTGPASLLLRARMWIQLARLLRIRGDEEKRMPVFKCWLDTIVAFATADYIRKNRTNTVLARQKASQIEASPQPVNAEEVGLLYRLEVNQDRLFRWGKSIGFINLEMPDVDCELVLDTGNIRDLDDMRLLVLYLNQYRIPESSITRVNGAIRIRIDATWMSESGDQILAWAVRPFHAPGDSRKLGLPIVSVSAQGFS